MFRTGSYVVVVSSSEVGLLHNFARVVKLVDAGDSDQI
ncbi:hypothetical protein BOMU111920_01010 [Bordetella muralis]